MELLRSTRSAEIYLRCRAQQKSIFGELENSLSAGFMGFFKYIMMKNM
jgi:hypothetical protein